MKKYLLLLFILCACNDLLAQKVEISIQAYSGLFHYAGNGSASTTDIAQSGPPVHDYTTNPYGNKNGFSYGTGLQAQRVSKNGFIVGLGVNYEILRSKVTINNFNPGFFYASAQLYGYGPVVSQVNGSAFLQDQSINLSPYIGYRLKFKKTSIDLLPGIDIDLNLSSYDKGEATVTYLSPPSGVHRANNKRPDAPADVRLKFGGALNYKRLAFTASYAHGLINYNKDMPGDFNVHSELIRFGIAYKLFYVH